MPNNNAYSGKKGSISKEKKIIEKSNNYRKIGLTGFRTRNKHSKISLTNSMKKL